MGIFRVDRGVGGSVTAAFGSVVSAGSPVGEAALFRGREAWQGRVRDLVRAVPESSGALALVVSSGRRVGWRVSGVSDGAVDAVSDGLSGLDNGRVGGLLWSVGECFLGWRVEGSGVVWDVFSPWECRVGRGKRVEVIGEDGLWGFYGGSVFRVFRGDPFERFRAWSPHLGAIDVLEAMKVHQLADTAVGTSRLAGAGVLWWPTDLPDGKVVDGVAEPGTRAELADMLQRAMVESIDNRGSRNAVVPLVVFADGEGSAVPQHVLLERPDSAKAFSDRMEMYALRYARSIDLPIEAVIGMGGANHWTAWVIKEDQWRFYLEPLYDVEAEALRENFVRPFLEELGVDTKNLQVRADGTELVSKPDKSDKAIRLAQLGGFLNREAVVRESGFDPELDTSALPEGAVNKGPRLQELPVDFRSTSPL